VTKRAVQSIQLDKYARDARTWRDAARFNYTGARTLFTSENSVVTCIPAATLAHLALEMFLKAALIVEGMTVFNPRDLDKLDHSVGLTKQDCVWGHQLVGHAKFLAPKRLDFDLTDTSKIAFYFPRKGPMTLEAGFAVFDPFFFELRYPQELVDLDGVGPDDVLLLNSLVGALEPFLKTIR
jgi:hypothetical protein